MSASHPRQLIVLCDGTNNNLTGGREDTHVVRLAELLHAHPDPARLVFYDPGVGNPGELPGATWWDGAKHFAERVAGLAFGRGVYENIAECYSFLMQHWQPGDQLFIFGFSRGAFTARSVAGLINQFGLLDSHMGSMVPTLVHLYFADRGAMDAQRQAISEQARRLFTSADSRSVDIQFVGVWDTVASVGFGPFSAQFTAAPTVADKAFIHVRQALALDEQRAQFLPRPYAAPNGPHLSRSGREGSLVQLWFRGDHSDVGGGHRRDEAGLARWPLAWVTSEAVQCGLRLRGPEGLMLSEAQVLQAAAALPGAVPDTASGLVHSRTRSTPWWALSGLAVRDPARVVLEGAPDPRIQAQAHPSVAALGAQWPQASVWGQRSAWSWPLPVAGLLMMLIPWAMAAVLAPGAPVLWAGLGQVAALAAWQLQAWMGAALPAGISPSAVQKALALDLLFIAAYATVLAAWAVAAFARVARLRQVGQRPSPLLQKLGWALPVAVAADLAEDAVTLAWLCWPTEGLAAVKLLLAVAMALCAALKCLGLTGVLALLVWGRVARAH
ncbi:DUF2235 domain-containing protein [Ideonella paludis]|uniref:DUF2235 domain-containing protein n=1 Tax=Ideonella paludis TaxID=1233411 RepID=A0ABS5DSU9_9BURK|nr:DUF2235 domain-containing protein [Ideonella paludis]MBQ0934224.1 DUF2235 domain-containing protein [Ideonella paludis]